MNNLIKSLFLIFFINYTSVSKAELVKDIEINGNFRVSDETVKIYGKIRLNKDYSEIESWYYGWDVPSGVIWNNKIPYEIIKII